MMTNIVNFEAICDELTGPLKKIVDPTQALGIVKERLSVGQQIRVELTNGLLDITDILLRGDPVEVILALRDEHNVANDVTMWPIYQTELAPADPYPDTGWGGTD